MRASSNEAASPGALRTSIPIHSPHFPTLLRAESAYPKKPINSEYPQANLESLECSPSSIFKPSSPSFPSFLCLAGSCLPKNRTPDARSNSVVCMVSCRFLISSLSFPHAKLLFRLQSVLTKLNPCTWPETAASLQLPFARFEHQWLSPPLVPGCQSYRVTRSLHSMCMCPLPIQDTRLQCAANIQC